VQLPEERITAVTERYAPDPHPGLVDRIAVWLFPSLSPDPPEGQVYIGPCDCLEAEAEAEAAL
jgi:hypothetical protein